MNIMIENCQEKVDVSEANLSLIQKTALECFKTLGFSTVSEVNIMLYDNDAIREVNLEQRNIDKATDVLSFPMTNMYECDLSTIDKNVDIVDGVLFLGDIIISLEKTVEQAKEYAHSFERELAFLTAHGIFHLLGYDHDTKERETKMFGLQDEVLKNLNLSR